jgi:hypothetical protein
MSKFEQTAFLISTWTPSKDLPVASALSSMVFSAMQFAKLYQRYATRCLQEARTTPDSKHRAFLIEMAQAWQRLADQAKVAGAAHTSSSEPDRGD